MRAATQVSLVCSLMIILGETFVIQLSVLFRFSGQNLFASGGSAPAATADAIRNSAEAWFNEYRDATMTNINQFGTSTGGRWGNLFHPDDSAKSSVHISESSAISLHWWPTEPPTSAAVFPPIAQVDGFGLSLLAIMPRPIWWAGQSTDLVLRPLPVLLEATQYTPDSAELVNQSIQTATIINPIEG